MEEEEDKRGDEEEDEHEDARGDCRLARLLELDVALLGMVLLGI